MVTWTVNLDGGPRRVNHSAIQLGDLIYSFGGYCSGEDSSLRKPIDIHVLDTTTFRWKLLPAPSKNDPQYYFAPYHRYGHTVIAYCGKAYLFGGRNDLDGACNSLFEFDPDKRMWRIVSALGSVPARDGHSACVIGDRMYIFGGFEEQFNRFSNETFYFNFRTCRWSELLTTGNIPLWRDFHTAVPIGDRMYVFGGRSDVMGQFHSNREIYDEKLLYLDVKTAIWTEPVVSGSYVCGRRSHSAFVMDGCMYIFGGFNGITKQHFNHLYKYDSVSSEWAQIRPRGVPPSSRRRHQSILVGQRLFLFGGTSPRFIGASPTHSDFSSDDELEPDLIDHSDLFILDFSPSLKTLCMLNLLRTFKESLLIDLPYDLRWEVICMTKHNKISPVNRSENSCG